jgi:hypothetical protein
LDGRGVPGQAADDDIGDGLGVLSDDVRIARGSLIPM